MTAPCKLFTSCSPTKEGARKNCRRSACGLLSSGIPEWDSAVCSTVHPSARVKGECLHPEYSRPRWSPETTPRVLPITRRTPKLTPPPISPHLPAGRAEPTQFLPAESSADCISTAHPSGPPPGAPTPLAPVDFASAGPDNAVRIAALAVRTLKRRSAFICVPLVLSKHPPPSRLDFHGLMSSAARGMASARDVTLRPQPAETTEVRDRRPPRGGRRKIC